MLVIDNRSARVLVVRTRCLADLGREKGHNHGGRSDERRGLHGFMLVRYNPTLNEDFLNIPSQAAVP